MIDCSKCKRDSICHTPDKHMGGCHSYEEADPDVVRVVRCRDCRLSKKSCFGEKMRFCRNDQHHHKLDHFCGYGERRNDATD